MNRLLLRSALRFYRRHPWQLVLALVGISLGVAVYVGVQLANASAYRAFELATDSAAGELTHRLLPVAGGLPDDVYRELVEQGFVDAAPIVNAAANLPDAAGRPITLLGIDPVKVVLADLSFRWIPGADTDVARLIVEPATVLVPAALADELALDVGSELRLVAGEQTHALTVAGTFAAFGSDPGTDPPLIADIGTAQELSGVFGSISRVDLELSEAEAARLAAALPDGTVLVDAASEDRRLEQLTLAFTTNLTALGLLALVVGMFLIYATMAFTIVQRRRAIAVLRAIGVGRSELVTAFLVEAFCMATVGTLAGLVLGHALADALIEMVLRTLDDLYFRAAIQGLPASPWVYAEGAVLGTAATLLAALAPAVSAARRDPATAERRGALERETRRLSRLAATLSIPTLGTAGVLLLASGQDLVAAFVALFLVLSAGAMLTPAATIGLMRCVDPAVRRFGSVASVMAVRGVSASLSRTGVATAALAAAVATVMSIGIMILSFRSSLEDWIDSTLTADFYLSADVGDAFTDEQVGALRDLPGVRGLSLTRFVRLPTSRGEIGIRAAAPGPEGWGLDVVGSDATAALRALETRDTVLAAEPYAFQAGLGAGDLVELPTRGRPRAFEIVGVFRDYNTAGSGLVMSLDSYRDAWGDTGLTGVGVHFEDGADERAVTDAISARLGASTYRSRSTSAIRRLSLAIFDRTFEVTEVLRLLAGLVAFLGVLSSVLAIQLERAREIAILRSIGMSAGQVARQTLTQTALLGASAGLLAIPLGWALAALLVHVINRRSFGWGMDLVVSAEPLLNGLGLAVAAALLAGIYPAIVGSRANLDRALRDE